MVYCESCGAANETVTEKCFVCQQPVVDTEELEVVPTLSATNTENGNRDAEQNTPTLLQDRYQILKEVGTGGFGAVYKAIDTKFDNRIVAIKEIQLQGLKPNEIIDATDTFNREVNILSDLKHPNLPRVYDHFTSSEHWYLVMDFIDGQTLEAYLDSRSGRLPLSEVFTLGIQICTVLDYLHTRQPAIIFRDLKPTNIMITSNKQFYLIDFGAARYFKAGRTKDTIAFGSPGYAAPEQYGKAQTTARSDIYSLGATLHEALTGKDPAEDPFHFSSIRATWQAFPPELEALIQRMVDMDMTKRPISAAAVKTELWRISTQHTQRLYALPGGPSGMPAYRPSFGVGQPPPASWSKSAPSVQQAQIQLGFTPTPPARKHGISRRAVTSMVILGIASVALLENTRSLWGGNRAGYPQDSMPAAQDTGAVTPHYDLNQQSTFSYHTNAITSLGWSSLGSLIASGSLDKTLRIWNQNFDGTEIIHTLPDGVHAVGWSPDGAYIAAGSGGKTAELQIWSSSSMGGDKPVLTFNKPSSGTINALAWASPDQLNGYYIATGSDDGNVHVLNNGYKGDAIKDVATYKGHKGSVSSLAWSASGSYLASGGEDTKVYLWPVPLNGSSSPSGFSQHTDRITALAWMGDKYLLSGSADKTVLLWSMNGDVLQTYHLPAPVTTIAWSTQNVFAIGTEEGSVLLYNNGETEPFYTLPGDGTAVRSIAWSPDGVFFVVGGDNKLATVWNVIESFPQDSNSRWSGGGHRRQWGG